MPTFSLTQIVKDPTYVNQSGADTLLDLVLTSSESQVCVIALVPYSGKLSREKLSQIRWK